MNFMQPHVVLSMMLAAITLVLLLAGWVFWLRLSAAGDRRRLRELEQHLERAREEISQLSGEREDQQRFLAEFDHAELSGRMRQPRPTGEERGPAAQPPERYRYLEKMVAGGMSAEEIAGVLPVSEAEARQLITLMTLTRPAGEKTLRTREKQPKKKKQEAREPLTGIPVADPAVQES